MNKVQKPSKCSNGCTNTRDGPPIIDLIQQITVSTCLLLYWLVLSVYYIGESLYLKFQKPEPKSVKGEIVLITGTGHGIGKQLALKYAEAGATVVGWDINEDNNAKTISEIKSKYNTKAFSYKCNVADREDIFRVAKQVEQEVGEVTIVIANAGIMPCHPMDQHTADETKRIIDINVMQLLWFLDYYLPKMKKKNRGHFVGISSIAGLLGSPNLVPYCGSKFAVRGILEALREELRVNPENQIKTTTIYPYMVDTGLCKNPVNKFDLVMQMLDPVQVAHSIMMAQRTDQLEKSIPNRLLQGTNILKLFPHKSQMKIIDLIGSWVDSDLIDKQK